MTKNVELPTYLTQSELGARWRVSNRTLQRWRARGIGPAWIELGGSIRLLRADVEAFEARQRCDGEMLSAPRGKDGAP